MRKKQQDNNVKVKQYIHNDKTRINNPPVGLVTAESDQLNGKKTYKFDPHIEPQLQWAGKAEGISFDVDSVSLHVHQRIDPLTIIQAVKKKEMQEGSKLYFGILNLQKITRRSEKRLNSTNTRWAGPIDKQTNRSIAGDSLLL